MFGFLSEVKLIYETLLNGYRDDTENYAMRTLEKALVMELSYPTTSSSVPIQPHIQKSPKLLWIDTGLVNYVADLLCRKFGSCSCNL